MNQCTTQRNTYEEGREVVIDMQQTELLPLLAQDDEDRVTEVEELAEEERVDHASHDRHVGIEGTAWHKRESLQHTDS